MVFTVTYSTPVTAMSILDEYNIHNRIGHGGFGQIFHGIRKITGEDVAVKVEKRTSGNDSLVHEKEIYKRLLRGIGIPNIRCFITTLEQHIMVMDLLGPSLEILFDYCNRKFSLKTVLLLVDQMIQRVEYVHSKGIIHRDLKPDNFLMGYRAHSNFIYLVDYGLAKVYRDSKMQHIPRKHVNTFIGTARYCSINAHQFVEQSRKDDLISLGYIWIYFLNGGLPWPEKLKAIKKKKMKMPLEDLCKGLPVEFYTYFQYCFNLKFDETPDYWGIRTLFANLYKKYEFTNNLDFDWMHKHHIIVNLEKPISYDNKKLF